MVEIKLVGVGGVRESFMSKMRKDGRITVPAIVVALLRQATPDLKAVAMEITLRPG